MHIPLKATLTLLLLALMPRCSHASASHAALDEEKQEAYKQSPSSAIAQVEGDQQVLIDFVDLLNEEETEWEDILAYLDSHSDDLTKLYSWDDDSYSLLHYAASEGEDEVIEELLARGVDVNMPTGTKQSTPLQLAAYYGFTGTVKFLLKKEANINQKDSIGCNVLHYAAGAYPFSHSLFKLLLSHGMSLAEAIDDNEVTLLHIAAHYNKLPLAS